MGNFSIDIRHPEPPVRHSEDSHAHISRMTPVKGGSSIFSEGGQTTRKGNSTFSKKAFRAVRRESRYYPAPFGFPCLFVCVYTQTPGNT